MEIYLKLKIKDDKPLIKLEEILSLIKSHDLIIDAKFITYIPSKAYNLRNKMEEMNLNKENSIIPNNMVGTNKMSAGGQILEEQPYSFNTNDE